MTGVGYRNQTDFNGEVKCSIMGGAELYVKGQGLIEPSTANTPQFVVENLSNLGVPGSSITDDEAFYSSPSNGKLAITAPSLLSMLNTQWDAFNGQGSLPNLHGSGG